MADLAPAHLDVVYPGSDVYGLDEGVTAWGTGRLGALAEAL